MESDFPNQTTNQLLITPVSEAALFTDPGNATTACNPAAPALFFYNQQDIPGHSPSSFVARSTTTSQPAFVNTSCIGDRFEIKTNRKTDFLNTLNHESTGGR